MAQKLNKLSIKSTKGALLVLSSVASISWIVSDLVTGKFHAFWALVVALVMNIYGYFMRFHGYRQQEF